MNRNFLLATQPSGEVQAAVFATGVVNPMEVLADIERELSDRKIAGKVLFDLLLSNGHKSNRYYVAEFDGKKFDEERFDLVTQSYDAFAPFSAEVLKEHYSEVNPSLLTAAMKFALRKGIPF